MKRVVVLLLALLLLMPQAHAAQESTALRFGTDEQVYSIYASYNMGAQVESVTVTFADSVKDYAYANFVNGMLWISIASMKAIDLNQAVGQVTAKDADGREFAPMLELASLQFNGEPAKRNLFIEAVQTVWHGETLNVSVNANDHFRGNYMLITAAYAADGRMLANDVKNVAFEAQQETFTFDLSDCAQVSYVKAFFMSMEWTPISTATNYNIRN